MKAVLEERKRALQAGDEAPELDILIAAAAELRRRAAPRGAAAKTLMKAVLKEKIKEKKGTFVYDRDPMFTIRPSDPFWTDYRLKHGTGNIEVSIPAGTIQNSTFPFKIPVWATDEEYRGAIEKARVGKPTVKTEEQLEAIKQRRGPIEDMRIKI